MDREYIKEVSIKYYIKGNLSSKDVSKILKDYCCNIHNKDEESTETFIQIILANFPVMSDIFTYALNYYENKFNIIKITKDNKILIIQ